MRVEFRILHRIISTVRSRKTRETGNGREKNNVNVLEMIIRSKRDISRIIFTRNGDILARVCRLDVETVTI